MEHEPLEQARDELCALPGVGRKTAACVLLFAFGRHDVPVDTHVHRVGTRLGLFRPGAPLEECHDELLRLSARRGPVRVAHGADPPRPAAVLGALAALRRVPAAPDVPLCARDRCPRWIRASQPGLQPVRAQLALVGIAAVWGLTFVMVQDAIAVLPTMAFLAYRFGSAAVLVAVIFRHRLRQLGAAGWRAGALMGVFLCAGYVFQTLGLEHTRPPTPGSSRA